MNFASALLMMLAIAVAVAHWPWLVHGLPPHGTDTFIFFPLLEDYRHWWASGHLPLWSDRIFCGQPVALQSEPAMLHPLRWALLAWAGIHGEGAWLYAHALLAGIGMFLYARCITRTRLAPVVVAFAAALGGPFAVQTTHPGLFAAAAWIPWQLWAVERIVTGPRRLLATTGLAVATAFQWLSGHAQVPLLAAYDVVAYGALRAAMQSRDRRAVAGVVLVVAGVALGAGLAAFQILPLVDVIGETNRAGGFGFDASAAGSLPPWSALLPVFPAFYGTEGSSDPTRFWLSATGADVGAWELHVYAGAPVALLAVFAVWRARRDAVVRAHVVLAAAFVLLAFGKFTPIIYRLALELPGLRYARVPSRALIIVFFSLLALAARGAALIEDAAPEHRRAWRRVVVVTMLAAIIPWVVSGAAVRLAGGRPLVERLTRMIDARHRDDIPDSATRGADARVRADEIRAQLLAATSPFAVPAAMNLALLALAGVLVAARLAAPPPARRRWDTAIVLALALDLGWFQATFGTRPAEDPDPRAPPRWASVIDRRYRVLSLVAQEDIGRGGAWDAYREMLPTNMGAAWGFDAPDGDTSTAPAALRAVFDRLHHTADAGIVRMTRAAAAIGVLRATSIGAVITDSRWGAWPAGAADWPLLYDDAQIRIWRVPDPLPRAFVAADVDLDGPRWQTAFTDPEPSPESAQLLASLHLLAGATVDVVPATTPDESEFTVVTPVPATFVRTTRVATGWSAEVDGRPAAIRRALGFFAAVDVPPGRHTVRFTYRPFALAEGIVIAAICGAVLAALAAYDLRAARNTAT